MAVPAVVGKVRREMMMASDDERRELQRVHGDASAQRSDDRREISLSAAPAVHAARRLYRLMKVVIPLALVHGAVVRILERAVSVRQASRICSPVGVFHRVLLSYWTSYIHRGGEDLAGTITLIIFLKLSLYAFLLSYSILPSLPKQTRTWRRSWCTQTCARCALSHASHPHVEILVGVVRAMAFRETPRTAARSWADLTPPNIPGWYEPFGHELL